MDTRKLYRSEENKMLAGVCGGLEAYTGIDATIIRLLWALWCFTGIGAVAYLIAAIVIPRQGY